MLMMAGGLGLALMKFCKAMRPPKVVVESAQVAITMAALGAAALAHSASRIASASFGAITPGSSITTIVWPCPALPAANTGFRLYIVVRDSGTTEKFPLESVKRGRTLC